MRINQVKKCRKSPGTCVVCGKVIETGSAYKWVQEYRGAKRSAHSACPFRMSHTTSGRLAEVYAAQEGAQDALEDAKRRSPTINASLEDCRDVLESLRDEVQSISEEYQEAADAIGENFDGSEQHQELEEKVSDLEQWIDDIGNVIDESADDSFDEEDDERATDRLIRRGHWLDERRDAADTVITECPL